MNREHSFSVQLYASEEHECAYLADQTAISHFIDPRQQPSDHMITQLTLQGFRRSGQLIYRPACTHCQACKSLRVLTDQFQMNRTQKRLWKMNSDITIELMDEESWLDSYPLYAEYITTRHSDGSMFPPTLEQFITFLGKQHLFTLYYGFYLNNQLIAVSVVDELYNGKSAVYTYFSSTMASRSLGTFAILALIDLCARERKPYLFLGYWVADSAKMRYKSNFRPCEIFSKNSWQSLGFA